MMIKGEAWPLCGPELVASSSEEVGQSIAPFIKEEAEIDFVDKGVVYTKNRMFKLGGTPYHLGGISTVLFEVGGRDRVSGYQPLVVSEAIELGGTLDIRLLEGYESGLGDRLDVLECSSFSGGFDWIVGLYIGDGRYFHPVYLPTGMKLEVRAIDQPREVLHAMEQVLEVVEDSISVPVPSGWTVNGAIESLNTQLDQRIKKLFDGLLQTALPLVCHRAEDAEAEPAASPRVSKYFRSVRTSEDKVVRHNRHFWQVMKCS